MTTNILVGNILVGEEPLADLLATTEEIFRDAAVELARAVRAARPDVGVDGKAAIQAIRDMKAAFQLAMDERNKLGKLREKTAGIVGDSVLDLDAARDEIGRRLARLRDAGAGD
ncbi:hypothetical protein [Pseudorhodobacter sp.]|uniref:hypothetical protein n=1 Tax=Pseudorhodobacter sp. TaxID=1934400 RepID=UPI0026493874|nr:hypothetical protein [Pseudorhodobacter sp.]MDN5786239.1 hypothetical protein [Pseudorhodobacter sp.]